ncbi:MAG: diacylglycerol kinase family lipid kinase [Clostridiales bacterium]|nr:diacylglycerol kinase family lipid kinase [Clostridiales bacterium]
MYHFIINPKSSSGKGIRYWWTVKRELDNQEIPYTATFTKFVGHATQIAEQICNSCDQIKRIVVLGGDGTVNEVINGFKSYKDILLGYIPSGSSNDLARSLKISKDPVKALERILKPVRFEYLDHGKIEFLDQDIPPRKFACSSGIGYDANVCFEVASSPLKKRLNRFGAGKLVYLAIAIKQVLTVKQTSGTVIIDGTKKDTYKKILLVSSMIHKYEGGGLAMAPHANPTDGKLSVTMVHGMSKLKVIVLLPTILFGKHIHFKGVETFDCSTIEIIADQKLAVHTDGETPAHSSHIKVNITQEKLRMIL